MHDGSGLLARLLRERNNEQGLKQFDGDAFDATVGLFGMLEVLMNRRGSGEPDEDSVRKLEGWIFGQSDKP